MAKLPPLQNCQELLERGKEEFNSGKSKVETPQESKLYEKIGELNMEVIF